MRLFNISKFACLLSVLFAFDIVHLPSTNGANILGLFTSHSPSHLIVHMSVAKALAEAGHNLTVVSSLKPKESHPSIKHIIIPPSDEQLQEFNKGFSQMTSTEQTFITTIKNRISAIGSLITMQYEMLKDNRFTDLYDSKFDLVIIGFFFNDFQIGVAAKFKCPVILTWLSSPSGVAEEYIGNPAEISYVPTTQIILKAGEKMTFFKRLQNLFGTGFFNAFKMVINHFSEKFYVELFGDEKDFPSLQDMKKNISLLFCNSHFSEGPIRPNVPALVEIGGVQIKEHPQPLPEDIAEFLNSAKKNGAILFCLGSNLKGDHIKPEIVQLIFKTLSSLKQKVIWKWDDLDNLPGNSSNILYKKWLPQDDILAHKNLKLFITHAGKGGVAEAQYHAVPMVALPFFADQPENAERITVAGYGLHLNIFKTTETEFKQTVLEVLENPKYKENVQRFSDLYRDRPLTARQNVVYWTEYVLRHHGAKHMQSPLVHLNFIQSSSLDVICFLILVAYIIVKVLKTIVKFIYNKIRSQIAKLGNKKIKKN